jgi:hypothetical protein
MTMTNMWGRAGGSGSGEVGCVCTNATGVWLGWTTTAADFEQAVPDSRATRATAVHLDKGIGVE